jgi:glycosyltransferase involved in cell wall biosynthesis
VLWANNLHSLKNWVLWANNLHSLKNRVLWANNLHSLKNQVLWVNNLHSLKNWVLWANNLHSLKNRVLWVNNLHSLKTLIKETEMKSKQPDARGDPFGKKQQTRIGFWNVRTLRKYGKLKQVEKEMSNYKLDIMGLSEIRWKENRDIKTQYGNSLIISGTGKDKGHRNGVGILMKQDA